MSWSRRRLIRAAGMIAGASAAGILRGVAAAEPEPDGDAKRVVLRNLHNPESLDIVYRRGDHHVPEAMARIEVLLRDYRTGAQHLIDPRLMDYLCDVAHRLGAEPVFSVISGYRSPQTNAMLHERSSGVSSRSLHMDGRAIDVRLEGIECAKLADEALTMRRGGVGYYNKSDFVHLDMGRFRTWRG